MNFDKPIDRRNTHSLKWDMMKPLYGVDPEHGTSMWVADMDFEPPAAVNDALQKMISDGVYGYFADYSDYRNSITGWMDRRHGWSVDPEHIFTTHGLVNAVALSMQSYTQQNDGVVLFTPVYHAFAKVINAAGRQVVSCELVNNAGHYEFDFDAYDAQMTGNERMLILCSPHNPGGRVWTKSELQAVAAFAKRHELILVSDEIHHDLTMPGHTHIPMAHIDGITDRLVTMTATTKTFNIAGSHSGNVIIEDPDLRARFGARMAALGISPNSFGLFMATAAYSPEGAAWVDDLRAYLDGNRKVFDAGLNAIPGIKSMDLQSTYLAWVDFADTGMSAAEFTKRVQSDAKIAANHGPTFGQGGDTFLRFNLGTSRAEVGKAVARLQAAFSDLQ